MSPGADSSEQAARARRLWLLGASVVVALLIAGILIVVSQGGDDPKPAAGPTGAGNAAKLFEGIPQAAITLGRPDAPVTLVEFVDLQCRFCADYSRDVLPTIVERYVRPGQVKLELRTLAFIGLDSRRGAAGTAVAVRGNRAWQFSEAFFASQGREESGYATDEFLRSVATRAEVDPRIVVEAANSGVRPPTVAQAQSQAAQSGIRGTPAFLIGPTDGRLQRFAVRSIDPTTFSQGIEAALRKAR